VVHSDLVPPATLEGHSDKEIAEWRTEYEVIAALRKAGHTVQPLGVLDSLTELRTAVLEWRPDVVFNLLEEFNGIVTYDQHVVAFLELLRQPYTGCNPRGLLLARDKVLCKQLLAFHRIPSPQFAVFRRGERFHLPRRLRLPLFVKSATEDASLGIAQASVVDDAQKLRERVQFMHEQIKSDALVEEYIEGRELYVGVLGNERLSRLPVWEMEFGSLPDSLPAIATRKVKWDRAYQRASCRRCCWRASIAWRGASIVPCICRAMRASIFACAPMAACSCWRPIRIPIWNRPKISPPRPRLPV
jgi:D-alanine-D-alanine ligase